VGVVLRAGSLNLRVIVEQQATMGMRPGIYSADSSSLPSSFT